MSGIGPQVTTVDNRPWYKKPVGIAGIVGGVVLIGVIASAGGGGSSDDTTSPTASASKSAATDANDTPKSTPAKKKAAAPVVKSTWKNVVAMQGNTNKSSADFHLNGCDTRLKYTVDGGDMALVAFYVMESGKKLMEDGGFPAASPSESGPGETSLHEDEGDYYLDVMGANSNWTATVQEKC